MPMSDDPRDLEREAEIFGRYLVGRVPSPAIIARYVAASETLFTADASPADRGTIAFVRRHPWSVGLLDGAAGLLRPGGQLRGRILVMGAILEASPEYADEFLPRNASPVAFLLGLAVFGALAVVRALAGIPLHAAVARSRA